MADTNSLSDGSSDANRNLPELLQDPSKYQSLWDQGLLGDVMSYLDWDTVESIVGPAIQSGNVIGLEQLTPEFVQEYEEEIMDIVMNSRNAEVLYLMLSKTAFARQTPAEDYLLEIAVEKYWTDGIRILYEAGACPDDEIMYKFYQNSDYEMVAYGILNGMPICSDFFFIHNVLNEDLEDLDNAPPEVFAKLNEAFHERVEKESVEKKRLAFKAYQVALTQFESAGPDSDIAWLRAELNRAKKHCRCLSNEWMNDPDFQSDDDQ